MKVENSHIALLLVPVAVAVYLIYNEVKKISAKVELISKNSSRNENFSDSRFQKLWVL